jgi:hypothetical protein
MAKRPKEKIGSERAAEAEDRPRRRCGGERRGGSRAAEDEPEGDADGATTSRPPEVH